MQKCRTSLTWNLTDWRTVSSNESWWPAKPCLKASRMWDLTIACYTDKQLGLQLGIHFICSYPTGYHPWHPYSTAMAFYAPLCCSSFHAIPGLHSNRMPRAHCNNFYWLSSYMLLSSLAKSPELSSTEQVWCLMSRNPGLS